YRMSSDVIGATVLHGNQKIDWNSADGATFAIRDSDGANQLVLEASLGDLTLRIVYTLKPDEFWLVRRLSVSGLRDDTVERITYGCAEVAGASVRDLSLGRFDRPRVVALKSG